MWSLEDPQYQIDQGDIICGLAHPTLRILISLLVRISSPLGKKGTALISSPSFLLYVFGSNKFTGQVKMPLH